MKRQRVLRAVGTVLLAGALNAVAAAVLFSDYFSSGAESNLNWVPVIPQDHGSLVYRNGAAEFINDDKLYAALAVHNMSPQPSEFTFWFKETCPNPGAGVYFCLQERAGRFFGYALQRGPGYSVIVTRFAESGQPSIVLSKESPFVRDDTNLFGVSKRQNRFCVFANGFFVASLVDAAYDRGDIALMVPIQSRASFDSVVVTDVARDSAAPVCFHDGFSATSSFGWRASGTGTLSREGGMLRVTTGRRDSLVQLVPLRADRFRSRAVVRHGGGSPGQYYGLAIAGDRAGSTAVYRFGIDSGGHYAISDGDGLRLDSGSLNDLPTGRSDTLTVERDGSGGLSFGINNEAVATCTWPHTVAGIGIFANESLTVEFDTFSIVQEGCSVPLSPLRPGSRPLRYSPVSARHCADLLGRSLKNVILSRRSKVRLTFRK